MNEHRAQKALARVIARLDDEENLKTLHLKHYHMSTSQFRKRTSHLSLPKRIYEAFDRVIKKCNFCNEQYPKPQRNRVSGLRAEKFADLIFMDHGTIKIREKPYVFLLILDAATSYLAAYPSVSTGTEEVIKHLHEWMDIYQATPKAICADMAFHNPHNLKDFYRLHNIRPVPTGPHTPWPNRAETAVRLFKKFMKALVEEVERRI